MPISFVTAALGGDVDVPVLEGETRITIPEGTQTGKILRLRGKGMPEYKNSGTTGDLIATLKTTLPTLNERQKSLLKEMKDAAD